ncbi:hypothetical protein [Streptomyces sp. CB01881]|uniref:hypothetical protein n=1 Tax=Streptomyces sp. CB01881 TaxID=2078691 RepID=UPI000CDBDAC0|nr:hypothetical protein [Streptomyces sp. CB01881]AUY47917.1 hypothetical protein C2142_01855 [Streptomyces sp. CB01881]
MRALVEIVVWWAVVTVVTVVLISSVSPVELLVAVLSALGAAFAARRMRLAAGGHFYGGQGAPGALLALPGSVLRGLAVLVTATAARPADATVRHLRLRPGAGWADTLLAASPDTCVIDVPADDEVVVHALRPRAGVVEEVVTHSGGRR